MGKLFKGKSPPPPPYIPPPPPPQEILDVMDEIAGTQTILATGPDGKKRRLIQKLPRSTQEEAFFQQGGELMGEAINNIKSLYQYNPNSVIDFSPIVNVLANLNQERAHDLAQVANFGNIQQDVHDFRQMQRTILDEEYQRQNQMLESTLAHQGLSHSTSGNERRSFMARDQERGRREADFAARRFGEGLANERLNRNLTVFGAREQERQGRLGAAQSEYALREKQREDMERMRQQAIEENMRRFQMGAGLRGEDFNKAMMSRAPELALSEFNARSTQDLNRYNAGINAQIADYQNRLAEFQNKPPSFGEWAMNTAGNLGTTLGMGMLTSPDNSVLGGLGKNMFGGGNSGKRSNSQWAKDMGLTDAKAGAMLLI